jgi:hypothetical protein
MPNEHQEKAIRDKIKGELQKDLSRIVTRQGRKDLSVRCIDGENELVFYFEVKRPIVKKPEIANDSVSVSKTGPQS